MCLKMPRQRAEKTAELTRHGSCAYVREMKVPPLLLPGSRVALVAPAGPLRDETDLQHAVDATRSMGWEPVVGAHVLERNGYLAGSDEHRLADLNRFANDRSIDGIWCIRGGYGAMRMLDQLDYHAWFRRPKVLIGYSDITAIHAGLNARADLVSFHGPTARGHLTDFSRASLRAAVVDGRRIVRHRARRAHAARRSRSRPSDRRQSRAAHGALRHAATRRRSPTRFS